MRILFTCEMVKNSRGFIIPAIEEIRNLISTFPCSWTPSKVTAIGLAEVNPAQLAAIEADSRIRAQQLPDNWEIMSWGSLGKRAAISDFAKSRGVDMAGVSDSASIDTVVSLISDKIKKGRSIGNLRKELQTNFGVK